MRTDAEQVEKKIEKLKKARKEHNTGRQKRLISELENSGIEVDIQEDGKIQWKTKT